MIGRGSASNRFFAKVKTTSAVPTLRREVTMVSCSDAVRPRAWSGDANWGQKLSGPIKIKQFMPTFVWRQ